MIPRQTTDQLGSGKPIATITRGELLPALAGAISEQAKLVAITEERIQALHLQALVQAWLDLQKAQNVGRLLIIQDPDDEWGLE